MHSLRSYVHTLKYFNKRETIETYPRIHSLIYSFIHSIMKRQLQSIAKKFHAIHWINFPLFYSKAKLLQTVIKTKTENSENLLLLYS
jgi:hypothetical protein